MGIGLQELQNGITGEQSELVIPPIKQIGLIWFAGTTNWGS